MNCWQVLGMWPLFDVCSSEQTSYPLTSSAHSVFHLLTQSSGKCWPAVSSPLSLRTLIHRPLTYFLSLSALSWEFRITHHIPSHTQTTPTSYTTYTHTPTSHTTCHYTHTHHHTPHQHPTPHTDTHTPTCTSMIKTKFKILVLLEMGRQERRQDRIQHECFQFLVL